MRPLLADACETPRKLPGWLAVLALALWLGIATFVVSVVGAVTLTAAWLH